MSTGIIVLVALISPFLSAFLLRYLRTKLTAGPFYSLGVLLFAIAGGAVIWLVQAQIDRLQVGNLVLVQPLGMDIHLPVEQGPTTLLPTASAIISPTAALPSATPTARQTATRTPTPTSTATPTITPTTIPPTDTPVPPTVTPAPPPPPLPPPPAPPAPPVVRRYTVQDGDTLRSIATRFGRTVQQIINANNLSASEADRIAPGDTLIIP